MIDDELDDAIGLANSGELGKGLEIVEACLAEEPQHVGALTLRGRFLTILGEFAAAEVAVSEAVALDPDYAEGHFALGLLRAEQGDLDSASVAFQRAIEVEPNHLPFLSAMIWTCLERDHVREASNVLEHAMQIDPFDPAILAVRGGIAAAKGDISEARECAELAVKQDPRNTQALRILASIELDAGDYETAADYAKANLEIDPSDLNALTILVDSVMSLGDHDRALAAVESFDCKGTEIVHVEAVKIRVLTAKGDIAAARQALTQAKQHGSNEPSLLFAEGTFHEARADLSKAAQAFENLLALVPEDWQAAEHLVEVYRRLGSKAKIKQLVRNLCQTASGNILMLLFCAGVAEEFHWEDDVETIARAILSIEPNHAMAMVALASRHVRLQQFDEAKEVANAVLTMHTGNEFAPAILETVQAAQSLKTGFMVRWLIRFSRINYDTCSVAAYFGGLILFTGGVALCMYLETPRACFLILFGVFVIYVGLFSVMKSLHWKERRSGQGHETPD